MAEVHPLDACVSALAGWAYTDSLIRWNWHERAELKTALLDDVEKTGTALLTEEEAAEFICGVMKDSRERPANDGGIPLDLIERFPARMPGLRSNGRDG